MAAYIVGQLDVKNTNWQQDYGPQARALLHKHGGKVIVGPGCAIERLRQATSAQCYVHSGVPLSGAGQSLVQRSGVCGIDRLAPERSRCGNRGLDGTAPSMREIDTGKYDTTGMNRHYR